jgi:hypothetical protein
VQQGHRHAGRVGFAVEHVGERRAGTVAALTGLDEHQHEVGGGREAHHRRDPARVLGPLRGQHRHRLTVAFGQPRPGRRPGDQAGRFASQRVERSRPFVHGAEA